MTKSEFQNLQTRVATSGITLKAFLRPEHVAYSTYKYWCRKTVSRIGDTADRPNKHPQ